MNLCRHSIHGSYQSWTDDQKILEFRLSTRESSLPGDCFSKMTFKWIPRFPRYNLWFWVTSPSKKLTTYCQTNAQKGLGAKLHNSHHGAMKKCPWGYHAACLVKSPCSWSKKLETCFLPRNLWDCGWFYWFCLDALSAQIRIIPKPECFGNFGVAFPLLFTTILRPLQVPQRNYWWFRNPANHPGMVLKPCK